MNKQETQDAFANLFAFKSNKEEIEHRTKMLMFCFLSEIEKVVESRQLKKKDLAKLIGTSPSYVTQLFRGDKTINLETIAKIEIGLDIQFQVNIKTKQLPEINNTDYDSIFDRKSERTISDLLSFITEENTEETKRPYWAEALGEVGESYTSLAA